ncbi:CLUMA_CG014594, isoform A [Clunio marinus]|uniref:CLUMA_CG014594, isoform A n=1 Tax=Clunio marinus TaxID=568069 RepID=A0A1J1ING1_9DIPT|nr:CLUMA_CG014594, isoform A [Clunio marinus]
MSATLALKIYLFNLERQEKNPIKQRNIFLTNVAFNVLVGTFHRDSVRSSSCMNLATNPCENSFNFLLMTHFKCSLKPSEIKIM